jgi:ParB family transcriptional regulator, chromosome partitioning protein
MLVKRTDQVDKHKIKVKEQARKQFDKAELLRLADSMFVEQLQPIGLTPDYTLCWGERRWRAAMLHDKITHLWAVILEEPMTESEFRVRQLTENLLREDLTPAEKTQGIAELKKRNRTWTNKDVAEHLKIDASQVTRLLSVYDCIPEVQKAYFAGQINGAVYGISKLPAEQQLEALAMALAGATREQIESHGKKKRNGTTETVRVSRVKIQLRSGVAVGLSGTELGMSGVVESLAETLKEARRANDAGFDVKTWQAMMADKAKGQP